MAKFPNITITQEGLNAIAKPSENKLIYTHIALGDGVLNKDDKILNFTELKSKKLTADIADISNDSNSQITLQTIVSNKIVEKGFYAREIGIYAKLGENGKEFLYGYANAGNNADYMPDNTQPIDELKLKITLLVGNVENVTAVINSSIIFITFEDCRREIKKHNDDITAHNTFARKKDVYTKSETNNLLKGKANTSHGNHVPKTETANNTRFLRNDNTWQTVTPANIGAPTKTGAGASGTWNINITGNSANAAHANNADVATKVNATAANSTSDVELVKATVGDNDFFRIIAGGRGSNNGYVAIDTADDGTEPIYVRQYTGTFVNNVRTAALLDANGNTIFPGNVKAGSFTGSLNGNATTANTATNANHASSADSAADVTNATVSPGVSNINNATVPASGVINELNTVTGSNNLTSTNKLRSYIGSVNNGDWYNVISIRHRNGCDDGTSYGLLMYSNLTNNWDTIHYKKQAKYWTEERTLLDSSNYNAYAPTKTGGGASGTWGINVTGNANTATTATKVECGDQGSFITSKPGYNDYSPTVGGPCANVTIDSWFGVSFTSQCGDGSVPRGKTAVGIDCRNGIVRANDFVGHLTGNADSAVNADTVDGYHASDLLRTLSGNRTPVMTDIFDRAGTIDLTALSAADKARNKAKIEKSRNSLQNIWNSSTGIAAYGGDIDMSGGYHRGTLKLTQSYKNFDKILVVGTNDDGNIVFYKSWNVYELAYAFSHSYRFPLYNEGTYWTVYGSVRTGAATNYVLSTDTIWSCYEQGAGIIAIYGIKY